MPNPWVIIGFLIALVTSSGFFYMKGDEHRGEHDAVVWEQAQNAGLQERIKKILTNRQAELELQALASTERARTYEENKRLFAELDAARQRLRDRPYRPQQGAGELPKPSGLGTGGQWATGANLYRDDGEFLVGEHYFADVIRGQRDSCYRLYRAAQAKVKAANQ